VRTVRISRSAEQPHLFDLFWPRSCRHRATNHLAPRSKATPTTNSTIAETVNGLEKISRALRCQSSVAAWPTSVAPPLLITTF